MNKKAAIGVGVGIFAVTGITVGAFFLTPDPDEAVNSTGNFSEQADSDTEKIEQVDEKYVGEELPNIINRAGTIKKVKSSYVVINGPDDEDITIYIDKDTKIYGPDGSEKEIDELTVGMYITVDIDGDERALDEPEDEFDAVVIYISGK